MLDLAQGLTRHAEVTVLAPDAPGAARRERWGELEVRRFRYFWPRDGQRLAYGHGIRENLRASHVAKLQPPAFVACQAWATRALVRERGAGWVNSHWIVPQGLSTALARGRRPRFRHALTVHAGDVHLLQSLPGGAALARFVLVRSDLVFAVGSHVRDALDRLAGAPTGARLEPMGADVARFDGPREPILRGRFASGYLLFVGRFAEKKGVVHLLRALPGVRERHPSLGLVLVGSGAREDELRREVARLGLEAAVVFAGRQGHDEVARYLRGCRLAVVPSVVDRYGETEGMPTVIVEAMAAGARVVATAVAGIPDVVQHGRNGWLCRPGDPDDLAEKILAALADPPDSPLQREARATAAAHDWARVAARYARALAAA